MNRLTNKDIIWYEDFVFSMRNRLITTDEINDSIYWRLKLLEDLEEDIGMSLLTLFRILKLGEIICKFRPIEDPKKILLLSRKIKSLYYDGCYYMLGLYEDGDDGYIINFDYVYIKDYGVTWGITKKELGDDR